MPRLKFAHSAILPEGKRTSVRSLERREAVSLPIHWLKRGPGLLGRRPPVQEPGPPAASWDDVPRFKNRGHPPSSRTPHSNPLPQGERGPKSPSPLEGEGGVRGRDQPRATFKARSRNSPGLTRLAMPDGGNGRPERRVSRLRAGSSTTAQGQRTARSRPASCPAGPRRTWHRRPS
jgi:hypothetical protein